MAELPEPEPGALWAVLENGPELGTRVFADLLDAARSCDPAAGEFVVRCRREEGVLRVLLGGEWIEYALLADEPGAAAA